jgi:hypothetical protein
MIYKKPELLNQLRTYYASKNIPVDETNIFGVRFEEDQQKDLFNDWLGVWTQHNVFVAIGTTDPGKKTTETSLKGAAHLICGYHSRIWQAGIHGQHNPLFAHPALCQTGNKISVWRDKNKDFDYDKETDFIDTGYFGINFHRASKIKDVETIGDYSAGCQVMQNEKDFQFFLNLLFNTEAFKKDKKYCFSYMLFDKKELNI